MAGTNAEKSFPCPHCGIELVQSLIDTPRHGKDVCGPCVSRATDSTGRRVYGSNVSMSGGFVAYYRREKDGVGGEAETCAEVSESNVCFIDGVPCYIDERRFGGTYIAPMKLKLEQIRQDAAKQRDEQQRGYTLARLRKLEQAMQHAEQLYAKQQTPPQ